MLSNQAVRTIAISLAFLVTGPGVLLAAPAAAGSETKVAVIQAPEGCLAPDVAVDGAGAVHMVYGLRHDAYYVQSRDNGKTFNPPIKLNGDLGVTTTMGERGPKLALGQAGSIHVIWADQWSPGVKTYVRTTRSLDGGRSFEAPRQVSDRWGCDGAAIAADTAGHVVAFWHVMNEIKPPVPQATWLYQTISTDNGATFAPAEQMKIDGLAGIACSMCAMRARFAPDGQVCVVFRSAEQNIRDHWVLKGAPTQNHFTAVRANTDNWVIDSCPMNGPELSFTPDGRALCAFMTGHKVYWTVSDKPLTQFTPHVATPSNEINEIYPSVYANRKGEVLFLWQVGPMSTNGTAVVKWARYTLDGAFTGQQGVLGTSSSGTRASAFVGLDDNFYIVTTARK